MSNLVNCQTCKKPVSSSAQRCPHCGEPDVFGNAKRIGQEIVDTARRQDLEKLGCVIFPILLIIFFIIFLILVLFYSFYFLNKTINGINKKGILTKT